MSTPPKKWVSQKQAAEILGVSARTLRSYIATGHLPAYRLKGTRTVRISTDDLNAMFVRVPTTNQED